ncbi:actin-related protein 2/3 complex subunit 2A isoform X2 [Lycium ferocissimum]|uniref:actin-related protein 2/3 complex subunit 2A isoform X2 n=1 Tax=Lycium ferocissimum TaxID=112874 RepID=UPI00281671E4|nr:actin-related protein 2/3 complex subunit 2A isoform X2 [Lycium ferocissimum]
MILLQSPSRYLLQILSNRVQNFEKGVELDCQWVEFDDIRYHIQGSVKNPNVLLLSVSLPIPPPETVLFGGLPLGALEAIKAAYGVVAQILDPPRDGFNLTLKLNLAKLPSDEEHKHALLTKIASVREVVMGAPLRAVLKQLVTRTVSDLGKPVALVHRPNESFFLVPQEFVEARRTAGLNNAPPCLWSPSPPQELKEAFTETLSANAGFVSFVIFSRHVEGRKLDRTVWNLSTFHAYVNYHVKCSECFMHTRMRRQVESLIQALDRAKPDSEKAKRNSPSRSFKRMSLKDGNNSFGSRSWK